MKDEKYPISVREIQDKVLPNEHRWAHTYWANIERGIKYKYWTKPRLIRFHTAIVRELFRRGYKHHYHPNSIDETLPQDLKEKSKSESSLKEIIQRVISRKLSSASILILGSGPSGGRKGRGKDKRLETSALVSINGTNLLINATHFLKEQIDKFKIKRIDAVLLTHGHSDVISGLPSLFEFAGQKLPTYSLKETFTAIHKKYTKSYISENEVRPYKKFKIADLEIIPVPVVHDEVRPREFPALAWQIIFSNMRLIWCEDFNVDKLPEKSEKYFKNNDVAILDCARLETRMIGHNSLPQLIPYIRRWGNQKTYLIQIGKDAPHQKIIHILKENHLYPQVEPSYDGQLIFL